MVPLVPKTEINLGPNNSYEKVECMWTLSAAGKQRWLVTQKQTKIHLYPFLSAKSKCWWVLNCTLRLKHKYHIQRRKRTRWYVLTDMIIFFDKNWIFCVVCHWYNKCLKQMYASERFCLHVKRRLHINMDITVYRFNSLNIFWNGAFSKKELLPLNAVPQKDSRPIGDMRNFFQI